MRLHLHCGERGRVVESGCWVGPRRQRQIIMAERLWGGRFGGTLEGRKMRAAVENFLAEGCLGGSCGRVIHFGKWPDLGKECSTWNPQLVPVRERSRVFHVKHPAAEVVGRNAEAGWTCQDQIGEPPVSAGIFHAGLRWRLPAPFGVTPPPRFCG